MSLVGSLEDLSLGDILQIISLSQKSGVLTVNISGGGGRIVFLDGLVRGAAINGGPRDLRGVVVGAGFLSEDRFDGVQAECGDDGHLASAISSAASLTTERLESLCREAVESAVVQMFDWTTGDFSFDVRQEPDAEDPELLLPTGINAQYLAMEGARQHDESSNEVSFDEMPADEMFGVVSEPVDEGLVDPGLVEERLVEEVPAEAEPLGLEPFAQAPLESEPATPPEPEPEIIALAVEEPETADGAVEISSEFEFVSDQEDPESEELHSVAMATLEHVDERSDEAALEPAAIVEEQAVGSPTHALAHASALASAPASLGEAWPGPVVVLDDDLMTLEWVKVALNEDLSPIHIFQRSEQGLTRIRQYLVRGEAPLVLIADDIRVDTLSGIRNPEDYVARLKTQSRRVRVLWLRKDGGAPGRPIGAADGAVTRPDRGQLRPVAGSETIDPAIDRFRADLLVAIGEAVGPAPASPPAKRRDSVPPAAMGRLRDATQALTEASSRGEVLPLVIRFASEIFNRVAMFMVRDGEAVGIAQHGLDTCGGPGDEALRDIRVDIRSSQWMSSVLDSRKPVCGAAETEGDQKLSSLLGNRIPEVAYMAPIESTGQVIALVYGDNLITGTPIGDTSALEVVLHHAGLALDRAALERALSESSDAGGPESRAESLVLPQECCRCSDTSVRSNSGEKSAWGRTVQRILIVEDSATMRSLLATTLEDVGVPVKITEASSGFEALRCLPREAYDLVVTDINMPDINGLELVSFVKTNEKYRGIPLIIVSTEGSDRDRDKGLELGADAYLVKPFEPEALRQVARDLLERQGEGH